MNIEAMERLIGYIQEDAAAGKWDFGNILKLKNDSKSELQCNTIGCAMGSWALREYLDSIEVVRGFRNRWWIYIDAEAAFRSMKEALGISTTVARYLFWAEEDVCGEDFLYGEPVKETTITKITAQDVIDRLREYAQTGMIRRY